MFYVKRFYCFCCCSTKYIRYHFIGVTLLYFKIDVMPLVPETKMADASILISLGKL